MGGQGDDTKDHQFIVQLLDQSVTSMKDIINELTDIVKIEANYKEQVETVSFAKILYEIEMMLKDKIHENNVKIFYDIQQQDIEFSRKNIRSILYNLISNAVKYNNPEIIPDVFVKIFKKDGMLHISVADNGVGIAEDQLELIFTPFTRLKKDIDGTGIGLHLVKKIIENEGGQISVSSILGEGTQFDITLELK
jgi:two-component system, OmpR family, phosphate regulon sensor histidine kinase PhoR